jgi:hypothetical protein
VKEEKVKGSERAKERVAPMVKTKLMPAKRR